MNLFKLFSIRPSFVYSICAHLDLPGELEYVASIHNSEEFQLLGSGGLRGCAEYIWIWTWLLSC